MRFVVVVFKKIWNNFLMIWLNYTICFLVFPGVCMKKTLFDLSPNWNATVIAFLFNMFDTLGKMATSLNYYSHKSATILVLSRLVFIPSFIAVVVMDKNPFFSSDAFALINLALFSFSGGYACSAHMVLAPKACKT